MHETPIRVDHVGIAVESVEAAEGVLFALGAEKAHQEASPDESFTWATYELGDASRLELIAPRTGDDGGADGDGDDANFVTEFLADQGPGLHHVTLEVADIDAVVDGLEGAGQRVVEYAAHDDWTEAFVSPRNPTGALFQLMEYHDGYDEGRDGAYIGGARLEADDE